MPGFANEDEPDRYIGGIFRTTMADPEPSRKLEATGLVLRMRCTEPDSTLVIDFPGQKVHRARPGRRRLRR